MAAEPVESNCINFVGIKFIDNTLYFVAEDDGNLESDYFSRLEQRVSILRDIKEQVLFLSQDKRLLFEDMPDADCYDNAPRTEMILYTYEDHVTRGRAVTISVRCSEMLTLSCENKVISFKKMTPPDNISDEANDIIFFKRSVPGHYNKIQFESSLYEKYFLACKKENDLFKLILKKKEEHGDESVLFTVQNWK